MSLGEKDRPHGEGALPVSISHKDMLDCLTETPQKSAFDFVSTAVWSLDLIPVENTGVRLHSEAKILNNYMS